MSDIVEWLRKEAELIALDRLLEAAADIERLRAALRPMVEHFSVGGGKTPIGKMLEDARRALEHKP